MKVGDKVVLIKDNNELKIGHQYIVTSYEYRSSNFEKNEFGHYIFVKYTNNSQIGLLEHNFISLKELRTQKLKQLYESKM